MKAVIMANFGLYSSCRLKAYQAADLVSCEKSVTKQCLFEALLAMCSGLLQVKMKVQVGAVLA